MHTQAHPLTLTVNFSMQIPSLLLVSDCIENRATGVSAWLQNDGSGVDIRNWTITVGVKKATAQWAPEAHFMPHLLIRIRYFIFSPLVLTAQDL